MKTWETTNVLEQQEIQHLGEEFLSEHKDHVIIIIKEKTNAVAPSGSDLFKPELWKAIHWNWFFETFSIPAPQAKKPSLWEKIANKLFSPS